MRFDYFRWYMSTYIRDVDYIVRMFKGKSRWNFSHMVTWLLIMIKDIRLDRLILNGYGYDPWLIESIDLNYKIPIYHISKHTGTRARHRLKNHPRHPYISNLISFRIVLRGWDGVSTGTAMLNHASRFHLSFTPAILNKVKIKNKIFIYICVFILLSKGNMWKDNNYVKK